MRRQITIGAALAVLLAGALGGAATGRSLAAPTITSISPSSGLPGSRVSIIGTNLVNATVTFTARGAPGITAPVSSANTLATPDGTRLTVTVPDGSDAADGQLAPPGANVITVTTRDGTASSARLFVVDQPRPGLHKPVITGFSPRAAAPGATVTITGRNLGGASRVELGGMRVVYRIPSESRILARVPKHAHSGRWSITTDSGVVLSSLRLTVLRPQGL